MTVYLLHFDRPFIGQQRKPGAPIKSVSHYLGYTSDLDQRIEQHRSGHGARLLAVLNEAGIGYSVAKTWPGTRSDERRLKRQHHAARLCPICKQSANTL